MPNCPKCDSQMITKDRSGIMIEECSGCRGVYLDRGELELLIDAESHYLATLPDGQDAETTYQGRHRYGVVQQVFGEPEGNGQASGGGRTSASTTSGAG